MKAYNPKGRFQTEDEAKVFDSEIKLLLQEMQLNYIEVVADNNAAQEIYLEVVTKHYLEELTKEAE